MSAFRRPAWIQLVAMLISGCGLPLAPGNVKPAAGLSAPYRIAARMGPRTHIAQGRYLYFQVMIEGKRMENLHIER